MNFICAALIIILLNLVKVKSGSYLDLSTVYYGVTQEITENIVTFKISTEGWNMKVLCTQCVKVEGVKAFCVEGEFLNMEVELRKGEMNLSVPFNVSCDRNKNTAIVRNIKGEPDVHSVKLSWTTSDKSIDTFIAYYFDHYKYYFKIFSTKEESYLVENLKEKTFYKLCIATIDKTYVTGIYRCTTELTSFAETGPVENVVMIPSTDSVDITWDKPLYKEDDPEAYIVTYVDEEGGSCGKVIIKMKGYIDDRKQTCSKVEYRDWTSLQKLTIRNLRPYTKYKVSISPFNKNKIQKERMDDFRTKEGESGPVPYIKWSITPGWLRIEYDKPSQQNGIVKRYKINLILQRLGICKKINLIIKTKSDINDNYYDIERSIMKKCSEYRVEVFPINGWSLNGGIGRMKYITFEYNPDSTDPISNLQARFISSNIARISWINPPSQNDCDEISYMVEIRGQNQRTDCATVILSKETCPEFTKMLEKTSECLNKEIISENIMIPSKEVYIGGKFKEQWYQVSVWKITHKPFMQNQLAPIFRMSEDCFTDCYGSDYKGIRSHSKCIKWKDSPYGQRYSREDHYFCATKGSTYPWCVTKDSYERCDIPKCSSIKTSSGCVKHVTYLTNSTQTLIKWSPPDYGGSLMGYMTLLYNMDNTCDQAHIQMCDQCPSDSSLENQIKNFYIFCKSKVSRGIRGESIFSDLHQNKDYLVYIIPLISSSLAGEVKKSSFRTPLAIPAIPENLRLKGKTSKTLSFVWNKLTEKKDKGLPKYFEATLMKSNTRIENKRCYEENVEFFYLDICTEYCLHVYATNEAGNSEKSDSFCQFTLAPDLGYVTVKNIESGPSSSRLISWTYSKTDTCTKTYRIFYENKYLKDDQNKPTDYKYIDTDKTEIILDKLKINQVYSVEVRPETKLETNDKRKEGKYSWKVEFYTGEVKPNIYGYSEQINPSKMTINITWSFNTSFDGSIFQFILVIRNSSNTCLNSVNFICKDCPEPYNIKNIPKENNEKISAIFKCNNKNEKEFFKSAFSLHHIFQMTAQLTNFSVEIYGTNLLGIHSLYGKQTLIKEENNIGSAKISIICLSLLFVLLIIFFAIILKRKKKPTFVYNVISNTFSGNAKVKRNSTRNSKSIGNSSIAVKDKNDSRKVSSIITNENVPLLEPKLKNNGVALKEFHKYYQKMSEKNNELIIQEYKKLTADCKKMEHNLGLTVNIGKLSANTKKNRFINILPFDQNRVKIERESVTNDYINANYVPFTNDTSKYEYIASQGPIEQSIDDFWTMISTKNINCIIMLTRTMEDEKFKCLQYWPENIGEETTYGNKGEIVVILENEIELESHLERQLIMKDLKNEDERKIIQLHMHTWFDHSAPNLEYFDKLLFRFHEIANNSAINPYLIHCSAGVGRTGTLICIDRIIKQLVGGCQEINIYDTVFTLRHYRNFMVQRQAQYIFIHDYIEHFLNKYMKMDDTEEMLYFNDD